MISGPSLGYPDRVYDDYHFAGADGSSVISMTTDVLTEEEVIDYVAAIKA